MTVNTGMPGGGHIGVRTLIAPTVWETTSSTLNWVQMSSGSFGYEPTFGPEYAINEPDGTILVRVFVNGAGLQGQPVATLPPGCRPATQIEVDGLRITTGGDIIPKVSYGAAEFGTTLMFMPAS